MAIITLTKINGLSDEEFEKFKQDINEIKRNDKHTFSAHLMGWWQKDYLLDNTPFLRPNDMAAGAQGGLGTGGKLYISNVKNAILITDVDKFIEESTKYRKKKKEKDKNQIPANITITNQTELKKMTIENINNLSEEGFKQFKVDFDKIKEQYSNHTFFLFGEEWKQEGAGSVGATQLTGIIMDLDENTSKNYYIFTISDKQNRIRIADVADLIEQSTKYREEKEKNEAAQTELYKQALFGYRKSEKERKQEIVLTMTGGRFSSNAYLKPIDLKKMKELDGINQAFSAFFTGNINYLTEDKSIDLRKKKLDADACEILAPALADPQLAINDFYLDNNKIGDEGCRHLAPALAEMKGLQQLWLANNKIGDEGCRHLAPALAKMKKLKYLILGSNDIGDEGCRHLAPALAKMKKLESLYLGDNKIGLKGIKVIEEAWKKAGKPDAGLKL